MKGSISGSIILVVLCTLHNFSPVLVSGEEDPDACYQNVCFQSHHTCAKAYPARPYQFTIRNEPCKLQGSNQMGDHTVSCCKSQKGADDQKEVAMLKNTARALYGASPNEYPHQIRFINKGMCGGTIYNKNWIITAAHCVRYKADIYSEDNGDFVDAFGEPKRAYVIAGMSHVTNATEDDKYYIDKIIRHEHWNPNVISEGNDVALLHLERPLNLKMGKIQTMRLEPADYEPTYGGKGYLIGYGNVHEKLGAGSDDLMEVVAPIHSNAKAVALSTDPLNSSNNGDTPLNIHLSIGGEDSGVVVGQGDSGGPFICADKDNKPIVCGIASFKSCNPYRVCRRPSYYQRVAPLLGWIKENTGNAQQESEFFFDKEMFPTQIHQRDVPGYLVRIGAGARSCTGTLISPKLIVTSAECIVANGGPTKYFPQVYHLKTGTKLIRMTSYLYEAQFQRNVSETVYTIMKQPLSNNDVGFLILKKPIETEYAVLPPKGYQISNDEAQEYTFNDKSNFVEKRNFVPTGEEDCARRFSGIDEKVHLNNQQLCMRLVYSPEAVCERDIGGPLICDGKYFCGLKSFHACKYPGVPEIFSPTTGGFIRQAIDSMVKRYA